MINQQGCYYCDRQRNGQDGSEPAGNRQQVQRRDTRLVREILGQPHGA